MSSHDIKESKRAHAVQRAESDRLNRQRSQVLARLKRGDKSRVSLGKTHGFSGDEQLLILMTMSDDFTLADVHQAIKDQNLSLTAQLETTCDAAEEEDLLSMLHDSVLLAHNAQKQVVDAHIEGFMKFVQRATR